MRIKWPLLLAIVIGMLSIRAAFGADPGDGMFAMQRVVPAAVIGFTYLLAVIYEK